MYLSDLPKYVGSEAKRVYVYAQTVVINTNLNLDYALMVRTRQLIIDRTSSQYISVSAQADDLEHDIEHTRLDNT